MSYLSDNQTDELIRALASLIYELHPIYSSTAGRGGGVGGQAHTPGCSYIRPGTEQEDEAAVRVVEVLHDALKTAQLAGVDTSTLHGYGIPHPKG